MAGGEPGTRDPKTGMTPREEAFVRHVVDGKAYSEAAVLAGWTDKNARTYAHKIAKRPAVAAAIEATKAAALHRSTVDAARVLEELARIALADPRNLFDAHGNLKPMTTWTREDAACVSSIDVVKRNLTAGDGQMDTVYRVRMWDKPKSLELLAKHFGMLTEKLEIKGDSELVARLAGARQRRIAVAIHEEES